MQKRAGLLAAIILALIAFYPALVHDGLPQGADLPLHYWKTFELENIWSQGELLPRWAESFYYGYGAPTWQFTAAAPYAVAVALGKLPLVDDVLRIKLVWGLSLLLSSVGVYHYATRRWGDKAALVAAAAFTFAPAIIYIEPIGRASYPASFGLGCMAASLALLDDYAHTRRSWIGGLAILTLVGLLLSHNITAVTGAAVLFGWLLWQWGWNRPGRTVMRILNRAGGSQTLPYKPRVIRRDRSETCPPPQNHDGVRTDGNPAVPYSARAIVLFILACGVTGFFWIPVAFERGYASIDTLLNDPTLDFHIHFEPLLTLLKPAARFDANLWNQLERWSLGMVTWPLAALGVVALFRRYTPRDPLFREMLFWLLIAVTSIFLVIPQSLFLWENLQILETFQFPVRFLNIAALPLAIFSGMFAHTIIHSLVGEHPRVLPSSGWTRHMVRARHAVLLRNIIRSHGWLILIVALIAQGIRATPANWTTDYPAEATVGQYIQHEIDSGILGTTAANEFLPADVKTIPPPTGFVIDSLAGGGLAQRINTWTYPDGVQFETLESSPTQYKFRVSSPDPVLAEVYLFKYPGWEATLDGDLVEMHLTGDFGFFGIYVPAGEHVVEIRYPLTTPQQAGLLLSGLSIVLIGGWLWMQRRGMDSAHCSSQKTGAYVDAPLHSHNRLRFVGADRRFRPLIIAYIIVLIGIVLLMREGVAWTASPPGEARLAADAYPVDFDGAVQLLGYQVVKAPADRVWRVSLYWFFDAELAEDESINAYVHLVDGAGQIIAQSDKFAINHITQRAGWRAEMHLRDTYHLFLPEDLPDGEYQLRVGLWRCLEGTPLDCTNRQSLPAMVGGVPVSEANVELH